MPQPRISAIAALGRNNRAICVDQDLLWRIPADLKRLKELTMGHTLVMGRKTYDSIGRPLKGRITIVVTRTEGYTPNKEGYESEVVRVAHSTDEALKMAKEEELKRHPENGEVFVFGGGEIYNQTLAAVERLYLTVVESDDEGTAHFPEYETEFIKKIGVDEQGDYDGLRYTWTTLERK